METGYNLHSTSDYRSIQYVGWVAVAASLRLKTITVGIITPEFESSIVRLAGDAVTKNQDKSLVIFLIRDLTPYFRAGQSEAARRIKRSGWTIC